MSTKGFIAHRITTDAALGAVGCSMAAAAATFGIYMTIHGPSASLGTSKYFSVYAQLAPHRAGGARRGTGRDDLDMTTTASIVPRTEAAPVALVPPSSIVAGITLRSVQDGRAQILIDGELRSVRVGDLIPGAGQVLAIRPGRDPSVRTAAGLIVAAQ